MNEEFGEDLVKAYSCVIKSLVARCEDVGLWQFWILCRRKATTTRPSFIPPGFRPFQSMIM